MEYPYQSVVIDDKIGEIVGFWKQIAGGPRRIPTAASEVYGIGGSWFRLDRGGRGRQDRVAA